MASEHESAVRRRKKLFRWGGGVLAAIVIAAGVAVTVELSGGQSLTAQPQAATAGPSTAASGPASNAAASNAGPASPTGPATPSDQTTPSGAKPTTATDFLSRGSTDKAALSASALFPKAKVTLEGRSYTRAMTATAESCGDATANGLGSVLAAHGCRRLYRATFVGGGNAVTVGVAVFDSKAQADKVNADPEKGYVAALYGKGTPKFCAGVHCSLTHNALGRYVYFTTAGYRNDDPVTSADKTAHQAGSDLTGYIFQTLLARGNAAKAAAG